MRLYGSLTNRIMETIPPAKPEKGMGATVLMHSDRYPATIICVFGISVTVQYDNAIRTDSNGASENQTYLFEPDPRGQIEEYTKRKNGTYVKVGDSMRSGTILRVGERDRYYDFSF